MSAAAVELGVDLGTSNTVAVIRAPDGRARTLLFDGSPLLPSAVYAEPSGTIIVGRDAIHSARLEPARFEPNPKRRIDEGALLLGDREVQVVDLLAAVLNRVMDEFRRTTGGGVTPRVTITCPAAWGATRRLVLSDAAQAVGLAPVRLVPEPVAAATYFTQVLGHQVPIGSVVVVHDFGAGTFDASVVARTASGFEVLAVDGRDDIGGLDVDEAIIGFVRKIAVERNAEAWARLERPSTVDERRARRLLWDDVRVAKERLSRQPAADLNVPMLGTDVHLTREELEALATPIVEQTIRVTQGVIRWSKLEDGRLAGVFLVGGSSRMPLVGTLLHRALGHPPVVIDSPELVVAEGSLLAGGQSPPEQARPVAGPATGVMAPIFTPSGEFVYPDLAGAGAGAPVSGPSAAPASGPGYGAPPVSAPGYSVSGPAYSTPASGPAYGAPVSAPGYGAQPPPGTQGYGQPGSAAPAYGEPGPATPGYGQPAYGQPGSATPVSAPGYGAPASGPAYSTPVSAPPVYGTPPAGAPGSGAQVSGPPGFGVGAPVSGAGAAAGPVSAPPGRPTSGGAVYGTSPLDPESTQRVGPFPPTIEPPPAVRQQPVQPPPPPPPSATRVEARPASNYRPGNASANPVYPPGVSRPSYREPAYEQPAYQEQAYAEPARVARRGGGGRAARTVLVTMMLVLVPLVCGFVAYRITAGDWPLP